MVESPVEEGIANTPRKQAPLSRVSLLVAHDVNPHKVRVHRTDPSKVENEAAERTEANRGSAVELVEEEGGEEDAEVN